MTLAPGACTKSHARVHALPIDVGATPPEVLKEYIESMRLLLTGDKVSYRGKFVNFDNVGLGWKPIRPDIPFYVPATASVGCVWPARLAMAWCSTRFARRNIPSML
jgi:5,10-methylenetetrahydromethanopterin reductase